MSIVSEDDYILEGKVYLLAQQRCLLSESNERVELTENNYRMLVCLLEGQTSKQKLIEKIWAEQNGVVSDSCYYGQVYLLRKSLVQAGISGDVIRTIPRKGIKYNGLFERCTTQLKPDMNEPVPAEKENDNLISKGEPGLHSDLVRVQKQLRKTLDIVIVTMAILSVCWLSVLFVLLIKMF